MKNHFVSENYSRAYHLADTMINDWRCVDIFPCAKDANDFIDEFVDVIDDEPIEIYPFCGWNDDARANVYLMFNTETLKYILSIDCADDISEKGELIVSRGDITERDFYHFNVDYWYDFTINEINKFRKEVNEST